MASELTRAVSQANQRPVVETDARVKFRDHRGEQSAVLGRAIEIGHHDIRFSSEVLPSLGCRAELTIKWPYLLQNVCQLELVATGIIVESHGSMATMSLSSFEFRTCGSRSFSPEISQPADCAISA